VQEIVDPILAGSFAVWQSKTILARSCESVERFNAFLSRVA